MEPRTRTRRVCKPCRWIPRAPVVARQPGPVQHIVINVWIRDAVGRQHFKVGAIPDGAIRAAFAEQRSERIDYRDDRCGPVIRAAHRLFEQQNHRHLRPDERLAMLLFQARLNPAVRRIIGGMAEAIRATKGRLQVIVLDHAPESVWGNWPLTHKVEEWRDGTALIPADWISPSTQSETAVRPSQTNVASHMTQMLACRLGNEQIRLSDADQDELA